MSETIQGSGQGSGGGSGGGSSRLRPGAERLPGGRAGQALALAVTLLPVLLIWLAVIAPLRGCYDERAARLAENQARLSRMEAAVQALPHLHAAARRAANSTDAPKLLVEGDSDAVAAAALQERLQAMATAAGVTIASADTIPPAAEGAYRRIAVRLTVTGDWASMVGLLAAIETATPRLLVDDMQIQAAPGLGPAGPAPPGHTTIDAALTIFGLRAGTP